MGGSSPFATPAVDQDVMGRLRLGLEEFRRKEAEREAQKLIDIQTQIISASFDKAAAYSNLVIVAGYGGFFGLWSLTKTELVPIMAMLASIFILISGATFVIYEVYKMFTTANMMYKWSTILQNPGAKSNPHTLQAKLVEFQKTSQRFNTTFIKVWYVVIGISVGSGFLAVVILLIAFLAQLGFLLGPH